MKDVLVSTTAMVKTPTPKKDRKARKAKNTRTKNYSKPPLSETLPELAKLVHPDSPLSAEEFSLGAKKDVLWICPNGHDPYLKTAGTRTTAFRLGRTCCPKCPNKSGYDRSRLGRIYLVSNPDLGLTQIGVTSDLTARLKKHSQTGFGVVLDITNEMDGQYIYQWEQDILKMLKARGALFAKDVPDVPRFTGFTESWQTSSLKVSTIKQLMDMVYEDELDEASNS